jgi:hypothetical protein
MFCRTTVSGLVYQPRLSYNEDDASSSFVIRVVLLQRNVRRTT